MGPRPSLESVASPSGYEEHPVVDEPVVSDDESDDETSSSEGTDDEKPGSPHSGMEIRTLLMTMMSMTLTQVHHQEQRPRP